MNDKNDFERKKICYEQNCAHARDLNRQMNQIPTLVMALTGGLWYAAEIIEKQNSIISFALLIFAAICNLILVAVVLRVRDVFQSYLERIKEFDPASFASGQPKSPMMPWLSNYSMAYIYCILMAIGAVISASVAKENYPVNLEPFTVGVTIFAIFVLTGILHWKFFKLSKKT